MQLHVEFHKYWEMLKDYIDRLVIQDYQKAAVLRRDSHSIGFGQIAGNLFLFVGSSNLDYMIKCVDKKIDPDIGVLQMALDSCNSSHIIVNELALKADFAFFSQNCNNATVVIAPPQFRR